MTALVWRFELQRALARPRLFRLNMLVPGFLVAALVLGGAPPVHAAVAYSTLFVFFGTFGSAIPLVRDAESGLLGRVVLTGIHPGGLLLQRCVAGAALDTVQLLPSLLLIAFAGAPTAFPSALVALFLALVIANVLGVWIAAAARSLAEAALFASVASLLLLHASGVFRTPGVGSVGASLLRVSPYAALHRGLGAASGLSDLAPVPGLFGVSLVWVVLGWGICGLGGASILRRLG